MKFPGLLVEEEMESFAELTRIIMEKWKEHV